MVSHGQVPGIYFTNQAGMIAGIDIFGVTMTIPPDGLTGFIFIFLCFIFVQLVRGRLEFYSFYGFRIIKTSVISEELLALEQEA